MAVADDRSGKNLAGQQSLLPGCEMIVISPKLSISEKELSFQFVRAGGPGGQNVNKVSTAVQLRFDVTHSPTLPYWIKKRLVELAGGRITEEGILIINAQTHRSQSQNRKEAIERLVALIQTAAQRPKRRHPTRPSKAAQARRREKKRRHSLKKQARRRHD